MLTNSLQLPEPIRAAIDNDPYDRGDSAFTTNELIGPVRIRVLKKRHKKEIVEDVSDRIFALLGQSIHTILERGTDAERYIVEKRFYMDVDGVKVGGQIDVFDKETHLLSDYKLCSLYVTKNGLKPEWVAQMNMNALIMRENGIYVAGMQVVAIFRDWSLMAADRKEDYPQRQVQVLDVPAWSEEATIKFIRDRIKAHQDGSVAPPVCTPEERWNDGDKWALMKKGRAKKAIKLFEDRARAEAAKDWNNGILPNPKYYVEERPAVDKRCKFYCPVAKWCDYGRIVLGL